MFEASGGCALPLLCCCSPRGSSRKSYAGFHGRLPRCLLKVMLLKHAWLLSAVLIIELLQSATSFHAQPQTKSATRAHVCTALAAKQPVQDDVAAQQTVQAAAEKSKGIYGYNLEVVQREEAEAPYRGARRIGVGIITVIAAACGAVSIAGLLGVEQAKQLSETLSLPNPLLDAGVLAIGWYIFVEDVKMKRMRLREIDAVYKLEQSGGKAGGNRTERRAQKDKKKKKDKAIVLSSMQNSRSSSSSTDTASSDTTDSATSSDTTGNDDDTEEQLNVFDKLKRTLRDVNQQSYAQAVAMNDALEAKGILPPIAPSATATDKQQQEQQDNDSNDTTASAEISDNDYSVREPADKPKK
eukprot:12642-Heterococcus_DN1.PRE.2